MWCSQTGLHSCLLSVCIHLKVTLYRALQLCHFLADAIVFFLCNIFPWHNSFCKHNFSAGMTFLCGTQLVDHCYIYCTRKAVTSKCRPCGLSVLFLHLTHFFQFYSYKNSVQYFLMFVSYPQTVQTRHLTVDLKGKRV